MRYLRITLLVAAVLAMLAVAADLALAHPVDRLGFYESKRQARQYLLENGSQPTDQVTYLQLGSPHRARHNIMWWSYTEEGWDPEEQQAYACEGDVRVRETVSHYYFLVEEECWWELTYLS